MKAQPSPQRRTWIASRQKRNRTGCVGIGFFRTSRETPRGIVHRHYFDALLGQRKHQVFCLETLGKEAAWSRAVKARAGYELSVRAGQAMQRAAVPTRPAARANRPDPETHASKSPRTQRKH